MKLLFDNIAAKGVRLTEKQQRIVAEHFEIKRYKKHQFILQAGDVARYENFIIKGIVKTYDTDEKGVDHVISFAAEDWWAGDLYSFFTAKPSMYSIDCIEDTELLRITKTGIEKLCELVPEMNMYYRLLYRNSLISYEARVRSSLMKSAAERYAEFIDKYPHIEQRVADHLIASYLGITPQSLSRLRRSSLKR